MHERTATAVRQCPKCGDEVPAGLVRCWKCNAFMREDVAEKYKNLVGNPQKIVFSDVPAGERTETIPPRPGQGGYARILDAEEDEFTLQGDESDETDFELGPGSPAAQSVESAAPAAGATFGTEASGTEASGTEASGTEAAASDPDSKTATPDENRSTDSTPSASDANADELLNIALTQEKEAHVRKRERKATMNRKRILIPCPSCGVWLRVREEQAGKSVRCRSCQASVPVPLLRRKEKKSREEQAPQIKLDWIDDVHFHVITPTEMVLKPGSLQNTFQSADAVFDGEGLHLVVLGGPPKKKSLFSRGGTGDVARNRAENREQIEKSGAFSNLPHGESHVVPVDALNSVRLVQPVRQAHESMFAGVPVFGEGRVAVYLPLKLDDGKQAFCSMALSVWRQFARQLKQAGIELPVKANGVPESEVHISPLCHYTQAKIESVRDVVYYRNDSNFVLELTGYRCAVCGISVSEAGRARNKLGGAAGKSIAKAKCPGCSAKFGNEPLYRISKAPDMDQTESDDAAAVAEESTETV